MYLVTVVMALGEMSKLELESILRFDTEVERNIANKAEFLLQRENIEKTKVNWVLEAFKRIEPLAGKYSWLDHVMARYREFLVRNSSGQVDFKH